MSATIAVGDHLFVSKELWTYAIGKFVPAKVMEVNHEKGLWLLWVMVKGDGAEVFQTESVVHFLMKCVKW